MHTLPAVMGRLVGSLINLDHPGHYVHWGFIQMSVANLVVIGLMVVVFVAAILDPVPPSRRGRPVTIDTGTPTGTPAEPDEHPAADRPEDAGQWRAKLRRTAVEALPPERLMPDRQPAYVASWIYVFGVLTLSALVVVILTGTVLAIMGPTWWHVSTTGLFVNSLHMWSVEVFFFTMVVHLWGKFFMAAWRGRRRATWITGVVSFVVSVGAAFTGLPVPAELRHPVDQHPGQGRDQLHRRRGHLQRDQLRSDAHVAHRPAATGGGAAGGRARPDGAAAGRGASLRPARPTPGRGHPGAGGSRDRPRAVCFRGVTGRLHRRRAP